MRLLLTLLPLYIAVMLLIQLIPVRINLFFVRENKDDFMTIRVNTFFSLLRFNIEIPFIKQETPFDVTLEAELKAGQDELVREQKKHVSFFDIDWQKVRQYLAWLQQNRKMLWYLTRFFAKALSVEKLVVRFKVGVEDAALTGMISGFLWTVIGTFTAIIQQLFRFKVKPVISINPEFIHQEIFIGRFDSAVSFRIGHFTIGGLLFMSIKFRGGKK